MSEPLGDAYVSFDRVVGELKKATEGLDGVPPEAVEQFAENIRGFGWLTPAMVEVEGSEKYRGGATLAFLWTALQLFNVGASFDLLENVLSDIRAVQALMLEYSFAADELETGDAS
jgi:hypothetical protein